MCFIPNFRLVQFQFTILETRAMKKREDDMAGICPLYRLETILNPNRNLPMPRSEYINAFLNDIFIGEPIFNLKNQLRLKIVADRI